MFRSGITRKLGLVLGGFAALFLFSTITGVIFLKRFESHLRQVATVAWPTTVATHKMEISVAGVELNVVKYLHRPDIAQRKLITAGIASFDKFHTIYANLAFTEQQKALAAKTGRTFSSYIGLGNKLLDLKDAHAEQATGEIDKIFQQFAAHRRLLDSMLDEDVHVNTAAYIQSINASQSATLTLANQTALLRFALWAALTILSLIFISRGIVLPLRKLSKAADKLSTGDFSQRVEWPAKDELGKFASTFNVMAERLQAAYEKLSRSNAELDAKVADRTAELDNANEQLNASNKRLNRALTLRIRTEKKLRNALAATHSANAASHAKTLFLGNMSHELRTPLNAIIGFSDMISQQMFGPTGHEKYTEYANDINQSGMHLLHLINELLDVSCIESGKLSLSEETFNLSGILEASLHMLAVVAERRGVILAAEIAGDLPFLHGDPTRVQQIFNNLLSNAIKFTAAGGVVRLCAGSLPDGCLQITVTDTGIGIAPEDLPIVLETFGQVANELTRAHEGAGLGLPMAKMLTGRHGGALEITSEVGCGTTVTVTFPASRVVRREVSRRA